MLDQKPDPKIVKYVGFDYEDAGKDAPPGSPQEQTLKFEAVGPGEVDLTLNYVSPGDGSVEESKSGTIVVK